MNPIRNTRCGAAAVALGLGLAVTSPAVAWADDTESSSPSSESPSSNSRSPHSVSKRGAPDAGQEKPETTVSAPRARRGEAVSLDSVDSSDTGIADALPVAAPAESQAPVAGPGPAAAEVKPAGSDTAQTVAIPAAAPTMAVVSAPAPVTPVAAPVTPALPVATVPADPVSPEASMAITAVAVTQPIASAVTPEIRALTQAAESFVAPATGPAPAAAAPAPAPAPATIMTAAALPTSPSTPTGATGVAAVNPFQVLTAALALVRQELDQALNRKFATAAGPVAAATGPAAGPAAAATGPAAAATSTGNTVSYRVGLDWGWGHIANMALTAGSSNLSGWTVEFDTPAKIIGVWNGQIVSHTGEHYVIKNVFYNGTVAAGKSINFGYLASRGAKGSAPTNIKVNGVPIGTSTPPATPPTLSIADVSISEGNSATTNANLAVTLSRAVTTPVTVGYHTANGTAVAGDDYTATTGTLTFAPGVTTQTIAVKVTGDTTVEPDETFTVTLTNPTGATLARTTATATITNDDVAVTPPTVSISDVSVAEGNTGTSNANFTVALSKATTNTVTVGYSTANGTAIAGDDYTATTGTLTFAPGVTTQTIAVKVTGDTTVEPDETFTVTLTNPTNATLNRTTATATITNDDVAPPPQNGNTVTHSVVDDWGSGHSANMALTAGSANLSSWTVEFDTPATITNIWNGQITSHTGTHYVVSNVSYNGAVAAGETTTFGYQATPGATGSAPTNIKVNGATVGTSTPALPAISIADLSVAEGNGEHSHFMFTVTMDKAATTPVTVKYATSDGTATSGADYVAGSGTLTFAAGVTTQTVHVDIIGDTAVEPDETFRVTLSDPTGATISRAVATGTIVNDDTAAPPTPPATTPGLSISDASVTEPGSVGIAPGYLHTSGNQIVDSQGNPVQLSSVNWFGAESTTLVPHGLWTRNYQDMIDQMADQGFNTIRLPFSSEMLHTTAAPNGIDFYQNPDLQGLSALQVMDKIVDYAGQQGMRVVLDHHRSTAGAGTSENGLWYNSQYTEDQWVSDWQMLAAHYQDNPTVIGVDLHNEPYNGTWGGGGANDWARAAERAGNAVLAVNPNLLVFVEGVGTYQGQSYWWGGNLMGVKDRPITLNVPNRVVYSPHDYPNSVWAQPWFQTADFGANLPNVFRQAWGYIYEDNIAPIWVGEFGTKLQDPKDVVWFEAITSYLSGDFDNNGTIDIPAGTEDMSWAYWSWNPNSGDTGGILADDWRTVNQNKMAYLKPIEYTGGSGTSLASFTVTLSAPSTQTVTVNYATSNGTATAGADYTAASGTLTFAPGETQKTVAVVIKSDSLTEGNEDFHVMLSNPSGATLTDAMGMGTIIDRPAGTTTTPGGTTPSDTTSGDTTGGGTTGGTSPGHDHDHDTGTPMPPDAGQYTDIMTFGMFHGSDHTGEDGLAGGRTAITTEALVAYNNLRGFAGLAPTTIEGVGQWAFGNGLTNNAEAWGDDLKGVGLFYAMQGAKVGWIADDKYDPQIVADIERTARLGSTADVMAMVAEYGHDGFAQYLTDNGYVTAFVDTLKMEPHYGGWMHDRAHGRLVIDGAATAHDLNHLTVLSHDQMQPFMNDTWDWPQWPALDVPDAQVIEYFQSMVALGDPKGTNLTALNQPSNAVTV